MCSNISMSIVEKVFHYEENEISVIKSKGEIWFRGKDIAKALGYPIPCKAIRENVDPEDRSSLECLTKGGLKWTPLKNEQKSATFINESGLYSLILQSKLESAKEFKRWVTKDALPSIRKTGMYDYCINHKYNNMLTFKIENEMDLHVKVVSFLNHITTGGRCFPRKFCLPVDNFLVLGRLPPNLVTFHNWVLAKFSISKIKNRRFLVAMVYNLSRVVFCQNQ